MEIGEPPSTSATVSPGLCGFEGPRMTRETALEWERNHR